MPGEEVVGTTGPQAWSLLGCKPGPHKAVDVRTASQLHSRQIRHRRMHAPLCLLRARCTEQKTLILMAHREFCQLKLGIGVGTSIVCFEGLLLQLYPSVLSVSFTSAYLDTACTQHDHSMNTACTQHEHGMNTAWHLLATQKAIYYAYENLMFASSAADSCRWCPTTVRFPDCLLSAQHLPFPSAPLRQYRLHCSH